MRSCRVAQIDHKTNRDEEWPELMYLKCLTMQASSSSTPNFQPIFENPLKEYQKKTGNDLTTHPLAAEINDCDSPESILIVLQGKANELNQSRTRDDRLTKWLDPTVNILNALSATLDDTAAQPGLEYTPPSSDPMILGPEVLPPRGRFGPRSPRSSIYEHPAPVYQQRVFRRAPKKSEAHPPGGVIEIETPMDTQAGK
ncbi:hypothetical protein EDB85DRAFT_1890027 [Lactarius pseudohatsudake]|nr:hypothetical protein EDB85DRAFT_1890027 [Lactarius pseudohatsudake]